jgi:CheY-like chemotaxis protein
VLAKQLRNHGCRVSVANHGVEALTFIEGTSYWTKNPMGDTLSIILLDLEMPVMDGLTCVRKIRELERLGQICNHLPVIAVTANARPQQIDVATGSGMVSWFLF